MSVSVRSPNTSTGRLETLGLAITDVESAVRTANNHLAQRAVKVGLEAVHELEDASHQRREWSFDSWTSDQQELLRAHVDARNIAHHFSEGIVELCNDGEPDDRLVWEITKAALGGLNSRAQAEAFRAHLKRQPVLPNLRELRDLLSESVK